MTTLSESYARVDGRGAGARADDRDDRRAPLPARGNSRRLLRPVGRERARGRRTRQHPLHDHRRPDARRLHPRLVRAVGGGRQREGADGCAARGGGRARRCGVARVRRPAAPAAPPSGRAGEAVGRRRPRREAGRRAAPSRPRRASPPPEPYAPPVRAFAGGAARSPAAGDQRDPAVLPHERDADLVRLRDALQPARDRSLGAQLRVPQLLRLVRRPPSERLRARRTWRRRPSTRSRRSATTSSRTRRSSTTSRRTARGKAVFLMFDEETERLAAAAGLEVAFPSAALRHAARLEDRDDAARGRGRGAERPEHRSAARRATTSCSPSPTRAGIGTDLVVQTPVRRLGPDDLLHRLAPTTGPSTRSRSSARS